MGTQQIKLPDERTLAFAQFGVTDGIPVIRCHGTPGSHFTPTDETEIARELGIRLIAPNRPGYGQSSFQTHRTLLDWAQ